MAVKQLPKTSRQQIEHLRRYRHRWRRRILFALFSLLVFFAILIGVVYAFTKVPPASAVSLASVTTVYDDLNHPIGTLHASENRVIIPFSQMPVILREAVISAEDRGFYHHGGVSIPGIVRAAMSDVLAGHVLEGGSTITQQYVKNAFVGSRRSFWRKIREAFIAVKLERSWSKDKILEAYLNTIYFGRGAYGVEAAAQAYFGSHASALTLPQAALLAGVIRAPSVLDPAQNPDAAMRVRTVVLDAMSREGYISAQDAAIASVAPFTAIKRPVAKSGASYFLEAVRHELVRRFGDDVVNRGGLKVHTTLDMRMQTAAENAVASTLDRSTDPEAALVCVDPATGSVRALVGGRNYATRQYDLATQAQRQPGSSFKPVTLAAYLEQGGSLTDRFRAPASITVHYDGRSWKVSNYDHRGYGSLSVSRATANSVNTVYAQMIIKAGPDHVRDMAARLGIQSHLDPYPSLALGTEDVTPLELANVYATFADDGQRVQAHLIARVDDIDGHQIYRFSDRATQAISSQTARLVTKALMGVIRSGTGRSAALGRPAAGKTGTTENHRDAWFAGYTPDLATVVWMGFVEGTATMQNVRGIQVTGGSFPASIWKQFMLDALEPFAPREFPGVTPPPMPVVIAPTQTASPSPSPSPSDSSAPSVSASPAPHAHSANPSPTPSR
ncbi:MAG: transglycosylase domain-containing protein [Actinomycetota bacterium]